MLSVSFLDSMERRDLSFSENCQASLYLREASNSKTFCSAILSNMFNLLENHISQPIDGKSNKSGHSNVIELLKS